MRQSWGGGHDSQLEPCADVIVSASARRSILLLRSGATLHFARVIARFKNSGKRVLPRKEVSQR